MKGGVVVIIETSLSFPVIGAVASPDERQINRLVSAFSALQRQRPTMTDAERIIETCEEHCVERTNR